MKHLKLFENEVVHIMKDYWSEKFEELFKDLDMLKRVQIPYELYSVVPFDGRSYIDGKLFFKIYNHTSLSTGEEKILKAHGFLIYNGVYEFTWNWKKIKEEDIQFIIDQQKYNL